ncbi:MAG: M28 family peptidase [Phycisphaerales bacterium]|nr:M28 family peptidase [Phycisphaerales bacterium]
MKTLIDQRLLVAFALLAPLLATTRASEIGDEIADQVDVATWRHYLDDLLYTHAGNNRGIAGAHHNLARENIVSTFESFGLPVERHQFIYASQTYQNIIATKIGRLYPDQIFVVGAHYDSVNNGGADDDGSGVASLMELARIFSQYDTAYTIKFCAWDAEEVGLRGSSAYVGERRDQLVRAMIQIDMIAHDAGANRQDIYASATALALRDGLVAAFPLYGRGQGVQTNPYAGFSDHAPFDGAQYPAICFVEDNYQANSCYHQPCDNVDNPNYIHYDFAANLVRVVGGYLADHALAMHADDCDNDGTPDSTEIAADPTLDCNGNGVLDACEPGTNADCNANGTRDLCDIASGASTDLERNGIPDECQATRLVPSQYPTIQAAINASVHGDTILVAPGTYSGAGNVNLNFAGKAITLRSEAGAATTIIQAASGSRGFVFTSGEDRRSIVDGFTIRGGSVSLGGGISCTGSSPLFRDCIITGNNGLTGGGGGVYLTRRSRPIFANCSITGNTTTGAGGGLKCSLGSSPLFINTIIAGNTAANGGAIHSELTSKPTLRGCTIARNTATNRGGAFYQLSGSTADNSHPLLENSIVWGNTAAAGQGPGIYAGGGTYITARFCDVQGGQAGIAGGGGVAAWQNCIDADPAFVDAAAGDYALLETSPCIDAASNSLVGIDAGDVDFDGDGGEIVPIDRAGARRFADRAATPDTGEGTAPIVDMGAFEFVLPCPADLDGSGDIGITDLSILLSHFGDTQAIAADGDLDGDADVDITDLSLILAAFGAACP